MTKAPQPSKPSPTLRRNERKWTRRLLEAGWTAWPSILLDRQRELGLSPLDLNILLQLSKHWWEAETPPYPSKASIAAAIGVKPRSVQRRVAAMEKAGLIRRDPRRHPDGGSKTNAYIFDGLIRRATPYADQKLRDIAARRKATTTRRPKGLRAVGSGQK